ncbi:hypothetical protein, partial [Cupriavidus numazuensis]|uniref:hypothetical protein n=1 Tax=Cupriavidus numazuensis TaxID=221992 RepID=UPI001BAD6D02
AVELMASGNDALFGYFLSLGQKVTRRLRRRNSGACQARNLNPNHKTPTGYASETRQAPPPPPTPHPIVKFSLTSCQQSL